MNKVFAALHRFLAGDRRRRRRPSAERANVVNRQYAVAVRLARMTGSTPEELLDYRRADDLLSRERR